MAKIDLKNIVNQTPQNNIQVTNQAKVNLPSTGTQKIDLNSVLGTGKTTQARPGIQAPESKFKMATRGMGKTFGAVMGVLSFPETLLGGALETAISKIPDKSDIKERITAKDILSYSNPYQGDMVKNAFLKVFKTLKGDMSEIGTEKGFKDAFTKGKGEALTKGENVGVTVLSVLIDLLINPTTYLTFGGSGSLKFGGKGLTKAGTKAYATIIKAGVEKGLTREAATLAAKEAMEAIAKKGGAEGVKLLSEGGIRFAEWLPKVGGQSIIPYSSISKVVEPVAKVTGLGKVYKGIKDWELTKAVTKAVSPTAGVPEDLYKIGKKAQAFRNFETFKKADEYIKPLKELGSFTKQEAEDIFNAITKTDVYKTSPDKIKKAADIIGKRFDDIRTQLVKRGVDIGYLDNYAPQFYEDAFGKEFAENLKNFASDIPGTKVDDIGEYLYHGTSAELKGGKLSFGVGDIRKGGQSGGLFLTDTPESAQAFGKTLYQASPEIKHTVIDLTTTDGIKTIEKYIGKSYKTFDGEIVKFTKQDFDLMFPKGKADYATVSQYPELIEQAVKDAGKKGIAFNEYAGGKIGKTYQILEGEIPVTKAGELSAISKTVGEGASKRKKEFFEYARTLFKDVEAAEKAGIKVKKNIFDLLQAYEAGASRINAFMDIADKVKPVGIDLTQKGAKIPEGFIKGSGTLADYAFPKDVANYLGSYQKTFFNNAELKTFLKYHDEAMRYWKTMATVVSPGFHIRNFMSNIFNSWLGGNKNPANYIDAAKIFKGSGEITTQAGEKVAGDIIIEAAAERGILKSGWFAGELGGGKLSQQLEPGYKKVLRGVNLASSQSYVAQAGRKAGATVEEFSRLAHFIDVFKKTGDFDAAAEETFKYLFDYGELTDFWKNVVNRAFPFGTWLRKNTALQFEQLFKQPGKYNAIIKPKKIIESITEDEAPDETYLPEWLKKEMAIRTPLKDSEGNFIYMRPDLPFLGIGDVTDWRSLLGGITPALKIPMELGFGKELFTGKNIERYPGYTEAVPGYIGMLPDAVKRKLGVVRARNPKTGKIEERMNPYVAYILRQNPAAAKVGKLIPFAEQTEYQKSSRKYSLASILGGVGITPYDVKYRKKVYEKEQQTALNAYQKRLKELRNWKT